MRAFGPVATGFFSMVLGLAAAWPAMAQDDAAARSVLQTAGVQSGLCVHLGCGRQDSPGLIADLAANSRLLVHGLALDDAALERARKAAEAKGLCGQVIVERVPVSPLPHRDHLANLVVIEDFEALAALGLAMAEIERITAPGGAILVQKAGKWTKTTKPLPQEMDDWSHPAHGPDGNMVSADRVVQFPVGLRWVDGVPMNFNLWAACRGWVISGGRCFTLSTTELENLGAGCFVKPKEQMYLLARDAFNGIPLWKINCETTDDGKGLSSMNLPPLVTDGQRVYTYKTDRLVALDAATGQVVTSFAVKYPSARLLLAQGVLVSAGWEAKEEAKDYRGTGLWAPWTNKSGPGSVEAFDARQGTLKWSVPLNAQEIVAADNAAYLLVRQGNPPTQQCIMAVELQSGRQLWTQPFAVTDAKAGNEAGLHLNCAGQGVVVVARTKAKQISILNAGDGKVLWEIPSDNAWTPMVEGQLWHTNKKYDPKTGQVKGDLTAGISSGGCTPSAIVGHYVAATRGCGYIDLAPPGKTGSAALRYGAVRGACIEGMTPAYGMFYTGQNFCRCAPGQVPGFVAFGPSGEPPAKTEFEAARPVEKGPAFGALEPAAASDADWSSFRHDAARSGAAAGKVPQSLKSVWQQAAAKPADGPLAPAWKARLASCMTSPVCADGKTIVAAVDAGQIVALDTATGSVAWRATAGGRIDTPPTLYRGLCLFGCRDGWIYALRAGDGKRAWRTRAAPCERRMVAFGQIESVWPAVGAVLIHDGLAYGCAGRTTESDGGVALCALDPADGHTVWAKQVGPGPNRVIDVLRLKDGQLAMHYLRFDPKTGEPAKDVKMEGDAGLEGFIDGTWTRLGTRRSGNLKYGRASGEMLAWNDKTLFGYECGGRTAYAVDLAKTAPIEAPPEPKMPAGWTGKKPVKPPVNQRLDGKEYAWRLGMKPNQQAEAMALASGALVLAGRAYDAKADKVSGFLAIVDTQTGKETLRQELPALPCYQGIAVSGGRIYLALENGEVVCFGEAG